MSILYATITVAAHFSSWSNRTPVLLGLDLSDTAV